MLAYGWAAYPYTLFVLNSNANDSLVALLVVLAFLALAVAARAGRAARARGGGEVRAARARAAVRRLHDGAGSATRSPFALAFRGRDACSCSCPVLPDGGVRELWDRTIGFQLGRDSPFSIWGQEDWLALAAGRRQGGWRSRSRVGVAFVPRAQDAAAGRPRSARPS